MVRCATPQPSYLSLSSPLPTSVRRSAPRGTRRANFERALKLSTGSTPFVASLSSYSPYSGRLVFNCQTDCFLRKKLQTIHRHLLPRDDQACIILPGLKIHVKKLFFVQHSCTRFFLLRMNHILSSIVNVNRSGYDTLAVVSAGENVAWPCFPGNETFFWFLADNEETLTISRTCGPFSTPS